MAIKVIELHHHAVRVGPSEADAEKALEFYRDVLGLLADEGRPHIPGVPGFWMDVGSKAQIHLMGASGTSKVAKGEGKDPTKPHVALAVPDIQETKRELDRLGVAYWTIVGLVGSESEQVFLDDPFGNMVELHQAGACRCNKTSAGGSGAMS